MAGSIAMKFQPVPCSVDLLKNSRTLLLLERGILKFLKLAILLLMLEENINRLICLITIKFNSKTLIQTIMSDSHQQAQFTFIIPKSLKISPRKSLKMIKRNSHLSLRLTSLFLKIYAKKSIRTLLSTWMLMITESRKSMIRMLRRYLRLFGLELPN